MNAEIGPYNYFVGPNSITFCCEGNTARTDRVRASAVYFPSATGSRTRISDKSLHEKAIFDGSEGEEKHFPEVARDTIPHLYRDSPGTARYIEVSTSDIQKSYDPMESLRKIFFYKDKYPPQVIAKLTKAVEFLRRNGIAPEDMGIYGGLQSFLLQNNSHRPFKDIDIAIRGLNYVPLIRKLAQVSQQGIERPYQSRVRALNENMRAQRHKNTKIYLPQDPDQAYCDVKVLRRPQDKDSFPYDALPTHSLQITGQITDASESLTLPCSYTLRTETGEIYQISSTRYDFIGTAKEGDIVEITGMATNKKGYILLIDPYNHSMLDASCEVR